MRAGANDYATKPIDRDELLLRVHNLLAIRISHDELEQRNSALVAELRTRGGFDDERAADRGYKIHTIRKIIEGGGPGIVFQPIVDLATGATVGVEALARFGTDIERPPDQWFGEAASVGLGTELELSAIAAALRHLDELDPTWIMAVNLSPATMLTEELHDLISDIDLHRMAFEVTEHQPIVDYQALRGATVRLRERGALIVVDDAGAGYASFRHILKLNPDVIKLDITLTRDVDTDPIKRALAASLARFAEDIGAAITAEGIETQAELDALPRGSASTTGKASSSPIRARAGPAPRARWSTPSPCPAERAGPAGPSDSWARPDAETPIPWIRGQRVSDDPINRRFEAIVFDWDGTAVPDRAADARRGPRADRGALRTVRRHRDRERHARRQRRRPAPRPAPRARPALHGAEPRLGAVRGRHRRTGARVDAAPRPPRRTRRSIAAAELTVERLAARGLEARIVSQRLNRRKIDVIPLPEWDDPPKARIDALVDAVNGASRGRRHLRSARGRRDRRRRGARGRRRTSRRSRATRSTSRSGSPTRATRRVRCSPSCGATGSHPSWCSSGATSSASSAACRAATR